MVKNNKMLETLFACAKQKGACKGCIYGEGDEYDKSCVYRLMNDLLFFFKNPVPSPDAHVMALDELEEALADHKDHLAFCEYISSIHVATPVIRTVSTKGNFINFYDNETNTMEQYSKSEYGVKFRVWSTKPTDKLRNDTPWTPLNEFDTPTDNSPKNRSKTADILNFIQRMS